MKIYISGKITGMDLEDAYELFTEAANFLHLNGHDPVNPMDKVSEQDSKPWIDYIVEDLAFLNECDAIFLLANWQDSKGARLEKAFCDITEKQIFYQETPVPDVSDVVERGGAF